VVTKLTMSAGRIEADWLFANPHSLNVFCSKNCASSLSEYYAACRKQIQNVAS
jgi:hypothetical protein